jgi:glycosyltransferase involved in cell wall biosynthesis
MRILFLSYTARPNQGSEPGNSWRTASALLKYGNSVTLLTQTDNRGVIENYLGQVNSDLKVVYCPSVIPRFFWNRGVLGTYVNYIIWHRRVRKMLGKNSIQHYDIAHHFSWGNYWLGTGLRNIGIPYVFGPCGYQSNNLITKKFYGSSWKIEIIREKLLTYLLSKTSNFRESITQSSLCLSANQEAQDKLFELTQFNSQLMMPEISSPKTFPSNYEISARKNLLWVGRFMPRKGVEVLLRAFSIVHREFPDVTLTLIGHGSQSHELIELAHSLDLHGNVCFLGKLENDKVLAEMSKYKALILPSLRESTGSQILEAASCAVPSVFFDFVGSATWFNKNSSYVVPTSQLKNPDDLIDQLANIIESVLGDDDNSYYNKCLKSFQISLENEEDVKANAYSEIYAKILGSDL